MFNFIINTLIRTKSKKGRSHVRKEIDAERGRLLNLIPLSTAVVAIFTSLPSTWTVVRPPTTSRAFARRTKFPSLVCRMTAGRGNIEGSRASCIAVGAARSPSSASISRLGPRHRRPLADRAPEKMRRFLSFHLNLGCPSCPMPFPGKRVLRGNR